MTYCVQLRKLALRMVKKVGVVKTSELTNISRCSLWRWKLNGVDPKRRAFESKLFAKIKAAQGKHRRGGGDVAPWEPAEPPARMKALRFSP